MDLTESPQGHKRLSAQSAERCCRRRDDLLGERLHSIFKLGHAGLRRLATAALYCDGEPGQVAFRFCACGPHQRGPREPSIHVLEQALVFVRISWGSGAKPMKASI